VAADGLLRTHFTQVHPHYRSPTAASFLMTSIETLIVIGLGFAGVAPYLGIASGAIGLGTVGIIAMQLVCAFAVVGFFWNSERANRLTTRILLASGGAGLALCLIRIIAHYSAANRSGEPLLKFP